MEQTRQAVASGVLMGVVLAVNFIQFYQHVPIIDLLRAIRTIVDIALDQLDQMDALFSDMYSETGRPSIAPERLLCASDCNCRKGKYTSVFQ
ncbi:hypothetical protein NTG1052_540013 [Candidatus Nitrotoga sp. 1052]|nr:hypothetical protein NTG1052_540013 [Candidatus Nitrotoga sp. 1052]